MTASTSLPSRRVHIRRFVGGFASLAVGALMIVLVFTPWLSIGGVERTGWQLYTDFTDAGRNGFYEQQFFSDGFSPFFSGLAILVAGGLMALIGVATLASLRGGTFRMPRWGVFVAVVLSWLIAIVGATNFVSLLMTAPDGPRGTGLFVLALVAVIGPIAVLTGLGQVTKRPS